MKTIKRKIIHRVALAIVVAIGLLAIGAATLVDLTTQVKNILPFGNGGTGQTTFTASRCVQVNSGGTALEASASACGVGTVPTFVDNEVPSGSLPGTTLTLAHAPNPAGSLLLFYNGQLITAGGADYTLATLTITLTNTAPAGTVFLASYRY